MNTRIDNIKTIGNTEMILIVRECPPGHEPVVKVIKKGILLNDIPISELQYRQRYNPDLKYYATMNCSEDRLDYILGLIKKNIISDLYTYI